MTKRDTKGTSSDPCVASPVVAGLLRFAERAQVPASEVLSSAQLQEAEVKDPEAKVPVSKVLRAWNTIAEIRSTIPIGLECSAQTAAGPVTYKALFDPTGRHALNTLLRFQSLISTHLHLSSWVSNGVCVVDIEHLETVETTRHPVEFAVGLLGRVICGPYRSGILNVSFKHGPVVSPIAYRPHFDAAVRFEASRTQLWIEEAMLDRLRPEADPTFARFLESRLEALLPKDGDSLANDDIEFAIQRVSQRGQFNVQAVAKELGMGVRTLQRRARAEARDIGSLLTQARRDQALRLVETHDLTLQHVAEALGYADERSFRRAFMRWTGTSPARWRARREPRSDRRRWVDPEAS
ncbi:MAG: AraC family transcriptional regulator ligand-binding domain-containing protein [Myxococcota bacterium]